METLGDLAKQGAKSHWFPCDHREDPPNFVQVPSWSRVIKCSFWLIYTQREVHILHEQT